MSTRSRWWTVHGLLVLIIFGGGIGLGLLAYAVDNSTREPVVVSNLREDDGIVVRGGTIDLVADVRRARYCPSETQRFLWRWMDRDGERVPQFVPLASTVAPIVAPPGRRILSLPVPAGLPAGEWQYRAVTVERCSWLPGPLAPSIWRTADVPVRIEQ